MLFSGCSAKNNDKACGKCRVAKNPDNGQCLEECVSPKMIKKNKDCVGEFLLFHFWLRNMSSKPSFHEQLKANSAVNYSVSQPSCNIGAFPPFCKPRGSRGYPSDVSISKDRFRVNLREHIHRKIEYWEYYERMLPKNTTEGGGGRGEYYWSISTCLFLP